MGKRRMHSEGYIVSIASSGKRSTFAQQILGTPPFVLYSVVFNNALLLFGFILCAWRKICTDAQVNLLLYSEGGFGATRTADKALEIGGFQKIGIRKCLRRNKRGVGYRDKL